MFYCKVSETVVDSRQKKNPRKHANRQKVQAEGKILKIGRWVLETSENRIHDTWSKTDKAWGRQRKQKNPGSVWPLCFAFFSQVLYFSPHFLCLVMHSAQKQNGLPLIALTPLHDWHHGLTQHPLLIRTAVTSCYAETPLSRLWVLSLISSVKNKKKNKIHIL